MKLPCQTTRKMHLIALLTAVALSCLSPSADAATVSLATAPLTTATTSSVKPNVMFILDDSGSMGWNYLPDWANDSHPVSGSNYSSMPELFRNSGFNGLAYNPAITYTPPVLYNADGSLNTTTYPNQTGTSTATGANTTVATPNWRIVKDDAYGVQSSSTSNLEGNAYYYVFVPGEYCSSEKLTSCVTATAPTTVAGVVYDKPALLRWCDSSALTNCQSINNSTFKYPRYPGQATPASATLTIKTTGSVTSIKVNGFEILSGTASSTRRTSDVAKAVAKNINNCTFTKSGNCTFAGYSASVSGSTVTIIAPASMGAISYTPVIGATSTYSVTAFGGFKIATPGSNVLTVISPTTTSYPYPGSTTKAATRTDCAGTTCTYAEEMTNYANWWTYYHTRMQSMKTSVSRAFKTLDNRFRIGFTTISNKAATDGTSFLSNNTFELAHKNKWFTTLFATRPSGSTPLRGALSKAGRYYANKISGQIDPVQYSCQQNFTILSTDGYWNTNDETSTYTALDLKGNLVGNRDGGTTPRPMKEGTTAVSDTLADIAKYYYDSDLRTSTLGNCTGGASPDFPSGNSDVCSNNVFTSSTDKNITQHMTTFTMGLGADGTLNYTTDYMTATSGDFYDLKNGLGSPAVNWSDPIANSAGERIDDMWHAAVNGQGLYFSAKDPDQIIAGFNTAISSITTKLGAASAAATSTLNPIAGNNYAFVASYTTNVWKGNLEARTINITTGVVSDTASWCIENITAATCASPGTVVADTSGSSTVYNCVVTGSTSATCSAPGVFDSVTSECRTPIQNSCPGTMPSRIGTTSDTRKIYTANSTRTALIPFDASYAASNPTNFSAAHINGLNQWGTLTPTQQAMAEGTNLVNYLRGQTGYEDRSSNPIQNRLYRAREATMGDALESQPAFVGDPAFNYPYPGYTTFKQNHTNRGNTVYIGTNDGMLHAFNATNGAERWAYVPSMVIPNLWKLASTSYSNNHANFVNGSALAADVCTANCASASATWKSILVAGLNGGGRGYFALDITKPDSPALLWEFTTANDPDMGYGFGVPVAARRADGRWVILLTSGHNNVSPGSGQGYLYALDPDTGTIISKISTGIGDTTTPSGLAKIDGWNNDPAGNQVGYVYGGDLLGNVWRFDVNDSTTPASIGTGKVIKFAELYADIAGNSPQPITTTPILASINNMRVIYIGTGKFLEQSDLTTTQVQTEYAIMDDDSNTTVVNPRSLTTLFTKRELVNSLTSATRTGSTTACIGFPGRGWYVDFPDPKERQNVDGNLVQGTLLIPTTVPSSSVCSPGGYSWLNYLDFKSGCPINQTAATKYDSPIVGINYFYINHQPVISVVTASDPTPQQATGAFSPVPAGFSGKKMIRRELLAP